MKDEDRSTVTFKPPSDRPLRLLPRHGEPKCVVEWASQMFVKALAYAPLYIAFIVTLTFVVTLAIFGSVR